MDKLTSTKAKLVSFILKLGRMRVARPFVNFFFNHVDHLMPVKRLSENNNWLAIYHPQPEYPLHILILPKRAIESLLDTHAMDAAFYQSLFEIATALIKQFNLEQQGYRLITNGGPNQIIPQWHWHLVSEHGDIEDS